MGYKDENLKHRLGVEGKSKFECPHCFNALNISRPMFMVNCSKCKKNIKQDEIIIN